MKRYQKIILATLTGLLVLSVVLGGIIVLSAGTMGILLAHSVVTQPARVAAVAERIADYQLPEGYREQYALHFMGFSLVAYTPGDSHGHIMLFQAPVALALDDCNVEEELYRATRQERYTMGRTEFRAVAYRKAYIRGQQVILSISEGVGSEHQPYRQVRGVFQGKGGPAVLVVTEPVNTWDQAAVEAFIASIQ